MCVMLGGAVRAVVLLCRGGQAGQPDRTIGRTDHRLGGSARTIPDNSKAAAMVGCAEIPRAGPERLTELSSSCLPTVQLVSLAGPVRPAPPRGAGPAPLPAAVQ